MARATPAMAATDDSGGGRLGRLRRGGESDDSGSDEPDRTPKRTTTSGDQRLHFCEIGTVWVWPFAK